MPTNKMIKTEISIRRALDPNKIKGAIELYKSRSSAFLESSVDAYVLSSLPDGIKSYLKEKYEDKIIKIDGKKHIFIDLNLRQKHYGGEWFPQFSKRATFNKELYKDVDLKKQSVKDMIGNKMIFLFNKKDIAVAEKYLTEEDKEKLRNIPLKKGEFLVLTKVIDPEELKRLSRSLFVRDYP